MWINQTKEEVRDSDDANPLSQVIPEWGHPDSQYIQYAQYLHNMYTLMMKTLYPWLILDWGYPHSGSCRGEAQEVTAVG